MTPDRAARLANRASYAIRPFEQAGESVRIGLVGCVKGKGPVAAPAGELYRSPLFAGRRRFVEQSCDRWFILSALHGLVDSDETIEPYDRTLVGVSVGERQAWSDRVLARLDAIVGGLEGVVVAVHAGAARRPGMASMITYSLEVAPSFYTGRPTCGTSMTDRGFGSAECAAAARMARSAAAADRGPGDSRN